MAKKRKDHRNRARDVSTSSDETARRDSTTSPRSLSVVLFGAGLVAYLGLFYTSSLPSLPRDPVTGAVARRLEFLEFLLIPRELFSTLWGQWSGVAGDISLWDRLPVIAGGIAILATAGMLGWLLMRALRADMGLDRWEVCVFSLAVGLGAVSLSVLLAGLAGCLNPWTVGGCTLLVIGGCGYVWRRHGNAGEEPRIGSKDGASTVDGEFLSGRWTWLAAPFVLVILLGGLLPPVDFDVREYHLQAPKEFFQNGRVEFLPHNIYANMALGTEMLSLLGMVVMGDWWIGALAGKFVIACFAPLTAAALFAAGRRFAGTTAGAIAAVAYISIPWVARVSTLGLVEGASACYLFLTFYAVCLWRQADDDEPRVRRGRLLLAGFLAGASVACKYPAALFVLVPMAVWIGLANRRVNVWPLAVFLLAATVGCGPWFAKNWALTGNPTYPLLYNVFDGATRTADRDAQWQAAHRPASFDPAGAAAKLANVFWRSEWLSPLVIPLALMALVRRRYRRLVFTVIIYIAFVLSVWWLFTHRLDRFWIPLLPLFALLAGVGATWTTTTPWRRVLMTLLVAGSVSNLLFAVSGPGGYNRYLVSYDRLRTDGVRVAPWIQSVNRKVPDGKSVLSVGDAQVFDIEVPVLYNTIFDESIFTRFVKGRTTEEVHRTFIAEGISHIYVNWAELRRYRSPGNYDDDHRFTEFVQPEIFTRLVRAGVLGPPERYPQQGSPVHAEIYPVHAMAVSEERP